MRDTTRSLPTPPHARLWLLLAVLMVALAAWWPRAVLAQSSTAQLPDFADLAERVGPSVVNIRTLERRAGAGAVPRGGVDPSIEEFFRRFGIPLPGQPDPRRGGPRGGDDEPRQRGIGSGFILSADGYIMTNAHVVDGADEVIVTLTDKRELKAKIVGADRRTDVAVVKVDASGLPAVKLGDVGKLRVGEWVVAIGSPFGLDNTVTAGIVSAKQRETGEYLPFIQTDVAINPGNSGGPLLNMRGEVVGINSQIYSRSGGFMGISFAIPIDEANRIADQLRASGRVQRGRIGVQISGVTKEVADALGLGAARGAMVQTVERDGPADKAGLEPGDIITKVDGRVVEKMADLPRFIGMTKPGSRTTLQVYRRGSLKELTLTVGEFEDERPQRRAGDNRGGEVAKGPLGLTVSDLSDAQKRELRLKGGVRVEAAEGAAARAGVREGDIIVAVDQVEVQDAKQFAAAVARADKSKNIALLVRRDDAVAYLIVRPQQR